MWEIMTPDDKGGIGQSPPPFLQRLIYYALPKEELTRYRPRVHSLLHHHPREEGLPSCRCYHR